LTCDPDNIASRKTIEKLGAIFIERKEIPRTLRKMFSKDERVKNIYRWEMKS
jgi:tagatose 1,6-diphosphate aldolase